MLCILSQCNSVGLLILLELCPVLAFLQHLVSKKEIAIIDAYTCSPNFSFEQIDLLAKLLDYFLSSNESNINHHHRYRRVSPRRSMYLLIVRLDHCVMRFAHAYHKRRQNLNLLFCLPVYAKPIELVIEIVFHYCKSFKCPFRSSCCERLDDLFRALSPRSFFAAHFLSTSLLHICSNSFSLHNVFACVRTTLFIRCDKPELTRRRLCGLHAGIKIPPDEVMRSRDSRRHSVAEGTFD